MADALAVLVVVAFFGLTMGGLAWVGIRSRRRGIGDAVLGAVDEVFHPAAHRPRIEIHAQSARATPRPSLGDPPLPGGSCGVAGHPVTTPDSGSA